MRICDICGATFEVVKGWQKRCSTKCNSVASNTRKRVDPSVKRCRTCQQRLPVDAFQPLHRSCLSCEELHASGRKRCTKCGEVKDHAAFHKRPARPDGCDSRCRVCRSDYSRIRNADPQKKRIDKDKKLRLKYGISLDDFEAMLERQQRRCGICGTSENPEQFHVDHDHATGSVRSLLCLHCNVLLAHAKEEEEILRAAILYLERHSNAQSLGP